MINLKQIAKKIETDLNAILNAENGLNSRFVNEKYLFATMSEAGKYKRGRRQGNQITHYISGILSLINSSTATANGGVVMGVYNCSYEFAVPLTPPRQMKVKKEDGSEEIVALEETEENEFIMPQLLRPVVDSYFKANKGAQFTDEEGINYYGGFEYSFPATGISSTAGIIGKYMLMTVYLTYNFVENGVNSSDFKFYLDGLELPFQTFVFNRTSTTEPNVYSNDEKGVAKNIAANTQIKAEFTIPALRDNDPIGYIYGFLMSADKNVAHELKAVIPGAASDHTYNVMITDVSMAGEYVKNAGLTVLMIEIVDDEEAIVPLPPPADAWVISFTLPESYVGYSFTFSDAGGKVVNTAFSYRGDGISGTAETGQFIDGVFEAKKYENFWIIPQEQIASIKIWTGTEFVFVDVIKEPDHA